MTIIDEQLAAVPIVDQVDSPTFKKSFSIKEKSELVQAVDLVIVNKKFAVIKYAPCSVYIKCNNPASRRSSIRWSILSGDMI